MGLFSNSAITRADADALQAFSPPLGLDTAFVSKQATVLIVKAERDDYRVTDKDGKVVIVGYGVALDGSRDFVDPATGKHIFKISSTSPDGWQEQSAVDSQGQVVFRVSEQGDDKKSEVFVRFTNKSTEKPVGLVLALGAGTSGAFRQDLVYGDRLVGSITEKTSLFSSAPAYRMTVAGGVDLAVMGAICVCYHVIDAGRRRRALGNEGALSVGMVGAGAGGNSVGGD